MQYLHLGALVVVACAEPVSVPDDLEAAPLSASERIAVTEVAEGVVDYAFEVRVGHGPYDRIGLHRLVAGSSDGPPIFLVHGATQTFRRAFATGEQSLAVHLARSGYDVWGVDVRGTRIPLEITGECGAWVIDTPDLSSLEDWTIATHVHDLRTAIAIARVTRWVTGSDGGPMPMLGYSRGGMMAYATIGAEAALPPARRQVSALLALETGLTYDDAVARARACAGYDAVLARREQGLFYDQLPSTIAWDRDLLECPDKPSEYGISNWDLAVIVRADPWIGCEPFTPGVPCGFPTPWWHGLSGRFGADPSIPEGFAYIDELAGLVGGVGETPYLDNGTSLAHLATACGERGDPEFDDDFGLSTVPVQYVGAAGGFGTQGNATALAFPFAEEPYLVEAYSPACPWGFITGDPRYCAYGHLDPLWSDNAEALVWEPIRDWLDAL